MIRILIAWVMLSFGLTALWVGAIVLLAPYVDRRPDPETEALDALERLWNQS